MDEQHKAMDQSGNGSCSKISSGLGLLARTGDDYRCSEICAIELKRERDRIVAHGGALEFQHFVPGWGTVDVIDGLATAMVSLKSYLYLKNHFEK